MGPVDPPEVINLNPRHKSLAWLLVLGPQTFFIWDEIDRKLDSGLIGKTRDNQKTNLQNQTQSLFNFKWSSIKDFKHCKTIRQDGRVLIEGLIAWNQFRARVYSNKHRRPFWHCKLSYSWLNDYFTSHVKVMLLQKLKLNWPSRFERSVLLITHRKDCTWCNYRRKTQYITVQYLISCVSNISIFSSLIKDLTKSAISSKSLVCNLISCLTTLFFSFSGLPFYNRIFLHPCSKLISAVIS